MVGYVSKAQCFETTPVNFSPVIVVMVTWHLSLYYSDNSKGKPITITCKDGDNFEADYVIVTTSLGYLKENARTMFCPPLPTPRLDLISRMGFGTAGKIWLEYKTPFWAENWGGIYLVWDAKPRDVLVDEFKKVKLTCKAPVHYL